MVVGLGVICEVKSHYCTMCMKDCRSRVRLQRSKFKAKVHFDKSQVTQLIVQKDTLGQSWGRIWEMPIFVYPAHGINWRGVDIRNMFLF